MRFQLPGEMSTSAYFINLKNQHFEEIYTWKKSLNEKIDILNKFALKKFSIVKNLL